MEPTDIAPLWMRILFSALCLVLVIVGIWKHGLRSWDWVPPLGFLGIFVFPAGVPELSIKRHWELQILLALWTTTLFAMLVHFWGWVPALVFAGVYFFPSKVKRASWKSYRQKYLHTH